MDFERKAIMHQLQIAITVLSIGKRQAGISFVEYLFCSVIQAIIQLFLYSFESIWEQTRYFSNIDLRIFSLYAPPFSVQLRLFSDTRAPYYSDIVL